MHHHEIIGGVRLGEDDVTQGDIAGLKASHIQLNPIRIRIVIV
jgi:hypothetical protein